MFPFQILLLLIVVYQLCLLYRNSSKINRVLRAHSYITSCASSAENSMPVTPHPIRNKYIQAPLQVVMAQLMHGDSEMLTLLAMLYGAIGPAKLCYGMAQFRDAASPSGFCSIPLAWLQFRYHGCYYVTYLLDATIVTMSYFDFMSTVYDGMEMAQDESAEKSTDAAIS